MRLAPMRAKRDADVVSQVANAVMSYHAPRSRATVSIVGLSVGVGTRADIIASFPSCASTAICHCPSYTLRAANYSKRHHHARPHHTSRDAILLTHSHPRAASGHTHCHLPTRYPHLVLLLPLGVAALQSHRVQLTEHYVTFTKPQHPDFWRAPL
jgi:hypothetical protein